MITTEEKTFLATFFKMMIMEEHGAQMKYKMALEQATSPEIQKLLTRFAGEEEIHAQLLESELMKMGK
jgi:rubrerythrin